MTTRSGSHWSLLESLCCGICCLTSESCVLPGQPHCNRYTLVLAWSDRSFFTWWLPVWVGGWRFATSRLLPCSVLSSGHVCNAINSINLSLYQPLCSHMFLDFILGYMQRTYTFYMYPSTFSVLQNPYSTALETMSINRTLLGHAQWPLFELKASFLFRSPFD